MFCVRRGFVCEMCEYVGKLLGYEKKVELLV